MDDLAIPGVDPLGERGILGDGAIRPQLGQLHQVWQGGVGQPVGRGPGHRPGHVGDAVKNIEHIS